MNTFRCLARTWRVTVPVVVGEAAVQSLLVLPDPVPGTGALFLLEVVASALAVLLGVWWVVGAATAACAGADPVGWRAAVRRAAVLGWAAAVGVVAVAGSLLAPWVAPVVLVLGGFVLPAAAAGESRVLWAAGRPFVRVPVRTLLAVLGALVLAALSAVVALLGGFFWAGWLGAAVSWLWLGAVTAVVLCGWCVLAARARGAATTSAPADRRTAELTP